jgi:hypothetical protein
MLLGKTGQFDQKPTQIYVSKDVSLYLASSVDT